MLEVERVIKEERMDAAVKQLIKTSLKYNFAEDTIIHDLMTEFGFTEQQAKNSIIEYKLNHNNG